MIKFGVLAVTFVETLRDDADLSTPPMHAKAKILL